MAKNSSLLSSRTIRQAAGLVGCVIMPHNVFLHSALVQTRDIDHSNRGQVQEAINYYTIESTIALALSFVINLFVTTVFAKAFYGMPEADTIGLGNAGYYLQEKVRRRNVSNLVHMGHWFISCRSKQYDNWDLCWAVHHGWVFELEPQKMVEVVDHSKFYYIPTIIVALVFDSSDGMLDVLNEWLNVLQSLQIPFALIPLLCLISKEEVVGVFKIGPLLKMVSWLVAALVMVINGYLLIDFFSSEVQGVMFGSIICAFTAAYTTFILYLVSRSITFGSWIRSPDTKNNINTLD